MSEQEQPKEEMPGFLGMQIAVLLLDCQRFARNFQQNGYYDTEQGGRQIRGQELDIRITRMLQRLRETQP